MIYEPKGKAREYSPLAVNLYKGCGHSCAYCYVPNVIKITRDEFNNRVETAKKGIADLEKSAKQYAGTDKQVLMSFTTDPYNDLNNEIKLTREALKIFLKYRIPVAILSKGGNKVLQDMDIIKQFGKHIKVGASLTLVNPDESRKWEKNAALPDERIDMLKTFHEAGIRTWVSMEPVIDPIQTLKLIDLTEPYVDEYQVGRLNHVQSKVDWKEFLGLAVARLTFYEKEFYIKQELAAEDFWLMGRIDKKYTDMDYLTLPALEKETENVLFEN